MLNIISNHRMAETNAVLEDLVRHLAPTKVRWILDDDSGLQQNNQVVVPVAAAEPDVASFLAHINMFSSTWYVAIDLVNVSLCLP